VIENGSEGENKLRSAKTEPFRYDGEIKPQDIPLPFNIHVLGNSWWFRFKEGTDFPYEHFQVFARPIYNQIQVGYMETGPHSLSLWGPLGQVNNHRFTLCDPCGVGSDIHILVQGRCPWRPCVALSGQRNQRAEHSMLGRNAG
jgi:hypothetical protein